MTDFEKNENMVELNPEEMEEVSGGKSAGQKVKATGSVRVRTGPGLDYSEMGIINKGDTLVFLGEVHVDNRGVAWYKVRYKKLTAWISSKYTKLI